MKSIEPPSKPIGQMKLGHFLPEFGGQQWECDKYYGLLRQFKSGFPIEDSPYAIISISHTSESARHDWRDYQQIKNALVGDEWEGLELYPSESRKVDPSNRFYLWCVPKGIIKWGLPEQRKVLQPHETIAPQRAWVS